METPIEFDLNTALGAWREDLNQSPHFRRENLDELESHLRDSIAALQARGLSLEEAFLIGARRVGGAAALEPAFAGENGGSLRLDALRRLVYRLGGKVIHGLILLYFTVGCGLLWCTLRTGQMLSHATLQNVPIPAFTEFFFDLMPFWYVPPAVAAVYCGIIWTRKARTRSWFGFFAITTAVLLLLLLPVLVAAGLAHLK